MAVVEVPQTLEYKGGHLNAAPVLEDFQDSPDDEEDTRSSQEYLNDLEEEYQARALLAKSKRFFKKDEEVSSDNNEMVEVKVLMALAKENGAVSKESAKNGEWVKIFMRKVHTLLKIEDNNDRKVCLDYLCIDLNYVKEQRSNLLSKLRDFVHELNTCKEQFLVLKQAKLDFLTMQHVNIKILKENKNLRSKLKELKEITKTWLNSSNKVNQCISEQIPSQKKKILGVDQLTEDPSSSGLKDIVFVKSSDDNTKVTIPGVERPWLSEAEGFILPNHDTADESSVCSTPLSPLKKLKGAEPISGPNTIKSITLITEALKCVIINEPSSAPAKGNKSSSASKIHSAHAGKLKSVKIKDDPSLAIDYLSKEREINPRNPQHAFKRCEACGSPNHTTTDHYDIEWFKISEALQAKKAEALKSTKAKSSNANRSKTLTKCTASVKYKVNAAEGVNAASEEVSTAELVKDMDQDSTHMVDASKVPMLKLGKFELWRIRIEQYIQLIDYALWEVIENGATLPKTAVVEGVEKVMHITSTKDKV
ncbi:hypothetical protein Tco_0195849 [Tanacetum coccineum]